MQVDGLHVTSEVIWHGLYLLVRNALAVGNSPYRNNELGVSSLAASA
jgi:hypothetical protein